MIKVLTGDIFRSQAQTLVNSVNCVGVMGKGIALEFKKRFPDMYRDYVRRCEAKQVKLGRPYLYKSLVPPWVLNFPTKDHWRSASRLEDIEQGLRYLEQHYREWEIRSLAVPPLGCGNGQLKWTVVGPILYRYLKRLRIPVELYAPNGTPQEQLQPAFLEKAPTPLTLSKDSESLIKPGWVALVKILAGIEAEPYHYPVGRTTFQKIAYFATQSGIPTGLSYQRGSYGPYAPGLKALITHLVNHGLIREERLGRMFAVKPGPRFEESCRAYEDDLADWQATIENLVDLFLRLDTRRAELAATVHFAARTLALENASRPSEADVLHEVMSWKQRRRPPFSEADVALAIRSLGTLGRLDVKLSPDLPVHEDELLGV